MVYDWGSRMQITEVRLQGFRNYASARIAPAPGLNVLVGENAAGKTNVLEAVFLCALGRSHRTPRDAELINTGADAAFVGLVLTTAGGTRDVAVRILRGDRKRISVDGTQLSRSGELMGCLNAVLFAPEDMALVKDGPGERRRFLDMELSQQKPAYYYQLQQYNLALRQRNALLRQAGRPPCSALEPWEEQLARLGASIMASRAELMTELAALAREKHLALSGGRETLSAAYRPGVVPNPSETAGDAILRRLISERERDFIRGSTGAGPHRDDMELLLDGADVRVFGSQGQQRTVVLSLKLSELEILRKARGEPPILLLDDVFSELDRERQRMLLKACTGCQTFITCTHLEEIGEAGAAGMRVYSVQSGAITEA